LAVGHHQVGFSAGRAFHAIWLLVLSFDEYRFKMRSVVV
jgi:hypothetical protein